MHVMCTIYIWRGEILGKSHCGYCYTERFPTTVVTVLIFTIRVRKLLGLCKARLDWTLDLMYFRYKPCHLITLIATSFASTSVPRHSCLYAWLSGFQSLQGQGYASQCLHFILYSRLLGIFVSAEVSCR